MQLSPIAVCIVPASRIVGKDIGLITARNTYERGEVKLSLAYADETSGMGRSLAVSFERNSIETLRIKGRPQKRASIGNCR